MREQFVEPGIFAICVFRPCIVVSNKDGDKVAG